MSVAIALENPNDTKETKIEKINESKKKIRNGSSELLFSTLTYFCYCFIVFNYFIIVSLVFFADIQLLSWKNKFINNSDSIIEIEYDQMQGSTHLCAYGTIIILFAYIICLFGLRPFIKMFRRIRWWNWIIILYISFSFSFIFVHDIRPSESAQIFTEKIFQDNYSLSTIPNSLFVLQCITIGFNIQHIICLIILMWYKPKNFDFFQYEDDNVEKFSPTNQNQQKEILPLEKSNG